MTAQPPNLPRPFSAMTKPMGPRCNIDCSYCYYLEKEELYPEESKFRMSAAVLETYTRELISAGLAAGQREISFAWHGGEPTLVGLGFFERAVELQRQYAPPGTTIVNTLQTNGMLVDDTWAEFFARERFLIGLSVDGPKHLHDRFRRDRAGRPTYDAVMRGLDALRRHSVEFNVLTAIHHGNVSRGKDLYRFLRELGTNYIQFIPVVERKLATGSLSGPPEAGQASDAQVADWSVSPRAYGKFLCDVFDIWYRQDVGRISVQFFENQLFLWSGLPASLCVFAETCGAGLAVEHNGDVYACDHYVYPEYLLGNLMETPLSSLAWSSRMETFGNDKRDKLTAQCQRCKFRFACHGGCPKHRILKSEDGEPGHNYFCVSYTMFFRHASERLKELILRR